MNLEQLYVMQKELDARIIREKGLEGVDLLPNTVLALQVEIGELANEWRGFKHWSNRQAPMMYPLETCSYCGNEVSYTRPSPFMADAGADMCKTCWDMTQKEYAASNDECIGNFEDYPHFPPKIPQRMLEEYVDCLHFFLSIALQLGIGELPAYKPRVVEESITEQLSNLFGIVGGITEWPERAFGTETWEMGFLSFIDLGHRFGFTWEQIAAAYITKNETNHERQTSGY